MTAPTHAEIPCQRQHYWCPTHEEEVCALSRTVKVKHADCKLRELKPADKGEQR